MKIAAYQFNVCGDIQKNMANIEKAIEQAVEKKVELIIFPECALTGYPPRDIKAAKSVDTDKVDREINRLQQLADINGINIIIGAVAYDGKYFNRAYVISPNKALDWYDKRALYGWDKDNFEKGSKDGVFKIGKFTIGLRICYEVRFPEYFRELYSAKTDLNIIMFNDVSENDDSNRYRVIRSHLITRAVENVTPVFTVNSTKSYQTAPTCILDASGNVLRACKRNTDGMIIYDFNKKELNFGEAGRRELSDELVAKN